MIYNLTTILAERNDDLGDEITVRCRVKSNPMPGESSGEKTVYLVDDPRRDGGETAALTFWHEEPSHDGLRKTAPYVLSALGFAEDSPTDARRLQREEELIVRAVPNRLEGEGQSLYLNVTSMVIREPDRLISKSQLRTQDRCPREHYLRYAKRVYTGGRYDREPYERANVFRGNAVHKIAELALQEKLDRVVAGDWTPDEIEAFCETQFETHFGLEQALLILSGAGLDSKDHATESVIRLFTDDRFLGDVQSADEVAVERFLNDAFGFKGRIDILLDGAPYDIKTTRSPDEENIERNKYQLKLYLFVLLLEQLEDGTRLDAEVKRGHTGYLIYPNTEDGVRYEPVELTLDDVKSFLYARNDATESADTFAPPSPYNRDCDSCAFAHEEWITGPDDALPPACTFHCQNERRWPCYERDEDGFTSDCSLFDDCDQRLQYRDPAETDHYESLRKAFYEERTARNATKDVLAQFDEEVLTDAGYLVSDLTPVGVTGGTIVRYQTTTSVVPAFEPGEIVRLSKDDGATTRATYHGYADGEFHFQILPSDGALHEFFDPSSSYRATYTFGAEAIDTKYLPYLDFAQRREFTPGFERPSTAESEQVPESIAPEAVSEYFDREELFLDLPVHGERGEIIADLVETIVTSRYPLVGESDDFVPEEARRALVLGTTPTEVEHAAAGQPEGDHFRLDGIAHGESSIQPDDGYHQIQTRLLDSKSLVSSVHLATSRSGLGGVSELFHQLQEGKFGDRDHSDNFFDVLVLLGGEKLTEPEFRFLRSVADRVVVVGDTRGAGPTMVSKRAQEAGLEMSYFEQAFDHYRSFPSPTALSLQLTGEAPPALQTFYHDGPWDAVNGDVQFLDIQGDEETAVETVELTTTVRADQSRGKRLVFDVTDTRLSPIEAQEIFSELTSLDATALQAESIAVINEKSMYLAEKERLEGENPTHHEVVIRAVASELPQFSRALLSNAIAEKIVAQVARETEADLIVTPFECHGSRIQQRLIEEGIEVPVRRPENLDGEIADHAIVSLATANKERIVRPPLDDPEVLYRLLSSGRDLTLVGNERTLKTKDVFDELIGEATPYEGP